MAAQQRRRAGRGGVMIVAVMFIAGVVAVHLTLQWLFGLIF